MEEYIVYVKTDEAGHITAVASSGFLSDPEGWTEIDRGSGKRYYHAQPFYLPDHILTESGVWRYKLADGAAVECSAEEIAAQEAALPKFYDESADMRQALEELGVYVNG